MKENRSELIRTIIKQHPGAKPRLVTTMAENERLRLGYQASIGIGLVEKVIKGLRKNGLLSGQTNSRGKRWELQGLNRCDVIRKVLGEVGNAIDNERVAAIAGAKWAQLGGHPKEIKKDLVSYVRRCLKNEKPAKVIAAPDKPTLAIEHDGALQLLKDVAAILRKAGGRISLNRILDVVEAVQGVA